MNKELEEYKKKQTVLSALEKTHKNVVLSFIVFNSCGEYVEGYWRAEIKAGGGTSGRESNPQFGKTPHEAMSKLKNDLKHNPETQNLNFDCFDFGTRAKELLEKSLAPHPPRFNYDHPNACVCNNCVKDN